MEKTKTLVKEKHNETETLTEQSSTTAEKVRADKDIIKYAETHELEGAVSPPVTPAEKAKKEKPEERTIEGFYRGTGKPVVVKISEIKSITRYIYVHNIFDPTPVIEHVQYKVIAPNTAYIVFDIAEDIFNELVQLPEYKGKVRYNYIDDMAKNDPTKNGFYHRTFSVKYPEWITPEDVQKQAQGIVSHYGIPDLSGIEKLLWPNFDGKIKKQSLSSDEPIAEEVKEVTNTQQDTPEE